MAHHQEARGVVWFVFDTLGSKAQLINFRGDTSGNGGHIRAVRFGNQTRCFGIAGHCDTFRIGQVAAEPVVALCQGLGMGENFGNAADFMAVFTQQVVMNADNHFAAGFQSGDCQQVQSTAHRAFGRIFYRRHQIIGLARFNLFEAVVDSGTRHGVCGVAEMFDGGLLGECSHRAQIGNRQRTLYRQTFAHNLAKQPSNRFIRQRASVQILNPAQNGYFPLRAVHRACPFQFADSMRMTGALVEQTEDFRIDTVDGIAVRQ